MRIYEFSKQSGVTSQDLIDALKGAGFEVSNHMSALSLEAIDFLNKKFNGKVMLTKNTQNKSVHKVMGGRCLGSCG